MTRFERTRRQALLDGLFGAGWLGLRALATGLPVSLLARPRAARAADCAMPAAAQYLILSTSQGGDPLNANAPGTYDFPGIAHSADPAMAKTALSLGGKSYDAAKPWSTLPQAILDRASFFHHATLTNSHANQAKVQRLMGATARQEMMVSVFAKALAPCLGTIQNEPVVVGANGSGELLSYEGRTLPRLSPRGLRDTLSNPAGPLGNLQKIRDADLDRMNALFKQHGNNVQRAFLDRLALSQREARGISQQLLENLAGITSDDATGQATAAAVLIKMNVSPVVSIHIPFGGDNHTDADLARETAETVSGVAAIGLLMQKLAEYGLSDRVTFAAMNVFGRTLGTKGTRGRDHLANHHVTLMIGKRIRSSVIGGLEPKAGDFGARAIDSRAGAGAAAGAGDIPFEETLGAMGKTLGAALGVPANVLDDNISVGKPVTAALI